MIMIIYYKERISLVTLNTRKARKILNARKALIAEFPLVEIANSTMLETTIKASNMFILSFRNVEIPNPTNLRPKSIAKTIVKKKLKSVRLKS